MLLIIFFWQLLEILLIVEEVGGDFDFIYFSEGGKKVIIEFELFSMVVIEKEGCVRINIIRYGNLD